MEKPMISVVNYSVTIEQGPNEKSLKAFDDRIQTSYCASPRSSRNLFRDKTVLLGIGSIEPCLCLVEFNAPQLLT